MKSPEIPANDKQRIAQLKSYNILNTLPEDDYDFITKMASLICNVPISLISLVDDDRQWFKSKLGLDSSQTDRNVSFCAHAINDPNNVFYIKDASIDIRFSDNPLVTSNPNIRFYAGVPLVDREGFALGTLCVIDNKPKELSAEQLSVLNSLSRQVVNLLELRKNRIEVEKANRLLKFKNKELEEFTYITSHDLQEPVRSITTLLEIISTNYSRQIDKEGQEMMRYVVGAGYRMKALILGLLDYSRLGKDKVVDKIDCKEILEGVQEDLRLRIKESNATIHIGKLPDTIVGFKTELRLLFQNLLSNAIKFAKTNVPPVINIECTVLENHWQFCVSDNGIGIEKQYKTRIFKIFQRLHGRDEYEGHGLGLTHCRKIIELHNGKIWVNSTLNKGSQFYFTIPKVL